MLLFASLLLAAPAFAQPAAQGGPPEKIASLIVYGSAPCPRGTGEEIIVCGREPESERYRLPKRLRKGAAPRASQESWSNTVRQLEWVSRAGTPNSCSPVGSGGATGCYQSILRQARAEREQARREAAGIP